jgi:Paraquat-inducible protein A
MTRNNNNNIRRRRRRRLPSLMVVLFFNLLGWLFSSSAVVSSSSSSKRIRTTRLLQTGKDFDSINQLFSGNNNTYIALPSVELQESGSMSLNLTNPICKDIEIGDMRLSMLQGDNNATNNNKLVMILQISGLNMNCISDFDFRLLSLIPGSATAYAYSRDNVIEASFEFSTATTSSSSSSFNEQPPTQATMLSCQASIEIYNLDFAGSGGLLAPSLDAIEKPFRNLLEGQVEKVICDEIRALADPLTNVVIPRIDEMLQPHFIPLVPPASRLDPLHAESTLLSSANYSSLSLINLHELLQEEEKDNNSSSSIMKDIMAQAKEMLTGPTGVANKILRDSELLDQDGCLAVNMTTTSDNENSSAFTLLISSLFGNNNDTMLLFHSHNDFAEMSLTLKGVRICGLDTEEALENFKPLEMIGNYTMRNSLFFNEISMDLFLLVNIQPSTLPNAILQNPDLTVNIVEENVVISLTMKDLNMAASTLIAIQQDELLNLPLGAFLSLQQTSSSSSSSSTMVLCLLSALHKLELTGLDVTVGEFDNPMISGFVDQGVQRVVSEFMQAMVYMYRPTVLKAIPNIFQGVIRDVIQDKISQALSTVTATTACPEFSNNNNNNEAATFLDFRDLLLAPAQAVEYGATGTSPYGDLIQRAVNLAKQNLLAVDPETGLATILNDALVRQLTAAQSGIPGRISFPGSLFDQNGRIQVGGLDASFSFRAYNAYIDNLDSIGGSPLSILDPIQDSRSELNNTARLGIGKPLQAGLRIFLSLSGKDGEDEIRNHMEISFDMEQATVLLTALLKISESAFLSFPLRDLINTDCLLMMIPTPPLDARGIRVEGHERSAGLTELIVNVTKMNLKITCLECSGPAMQELQGLLSTPEASHAATATVNDVFNFATNLLGGTFMQVQIDRMLSQARLKCPSSPEYEPSFVTSKYESFETPEQEDTSTQFLIMLGISVAVIIVTVLAIILVVKLIVRRRHRKWIGTVSGSKAIMLWDRQRQEQTKVAELNKISKSMFTSSAVPLWLRLLMPAIIIGNIGFFVSGHLSLAATVNIVVQLGGQVIRYDSFFEFSMMKSTIEIWNAGGKELAVLIMIFSVIWPYTKQIITLGLWFAPPRFVSISRRESILLWLDAFAKWSMVDIMTLIVTIVGFRVSINSPDVGFLPENIYSIDLLVAPLWVRT